MFKFSEVNGINLGFSESEYGNSERNSYIKAWIVLGLFSNMYDYSNQMVVFSFWEKIITGNNQIREFVHISLENYLVALCDLNVLYEKVNMI